ncbi:MAG: LPS translocon maturation chaperone LptM [Arenicellales bacterium]
MKIRFTGLLLLTSLFLLSACGQKGPLYLEKAPAPEVKASDPEREATKEMTESEVKPEDKD